MPVHNLKLSQHDQNVLDSIFDPFQTGQSECSINSNQEYNEELPELPEVENDDDKEAIKFEVDAIQETEKENYENALRLYAGALNLAPNRASIWNNRAQTYRLMDDDDGLYDFVILF